MVWPEIAADAWTALQRRLLLEQWLRDGPDLKPVHNKATETSVADGHA